MRSQPGSQYRLQQTRHEHIPRGVLKPNADVLLSILADLGLTTADAVYIGDSLMKDISMAAVAEGTKFEEAIREYLPEAGMTAGITARSRLPIGRRLSFLAGKTGWDTENGQRVMHSDHKLRWFYRLGTFAFLLGAVALQLAVWLPGSLTDASPSTPPATTRPLPAAPSPSATP